MKKEEMKAFATATLALFSLTVIENFKNTPP